MCAGDGTHQTGFADTIGAQNTGYLTDLSGQVDIKQDLRFAIKQIEVSRFEHFTIFLSKHQ